MALRLTRVCSQALVAQTCLIYPQNSTNAVKQGPRQRVDAGVGLCICVLWRCLNVQLLHHQVLV